MAILKCKMCGGDLEVVSGSTVAECEYCGSRQTVPAADDDKKLTLFARANRLRMGCEFDKAAGVYESIVADFPEEAEAYWGLMLCKYGIEYVDDPATGKKIPTCHRSSFESVFEENNFEQTLENADPIARSVYREEAKLIEEIRKGIIEVSNKEEPYDIFICYKETGHDGNRTIDSVYAQNVYDSLTEKGYRVFFARITLEDKLGREYEPYIFAALNSAKVMLVFGTDYEYFNAVWVKNEWSRFLQLIARGEKKTLIPCYKDIDAYDMPKEFARLQAQDMGKLGWEQDLIRGVQKILPKESKAAEVAAPAAKSTATTDTLLKRAYLFAADGEWTKADEYIEKVLDIDPENPEAYICKLMVEYRAGKEADLANANSRLDISQSYKKATLYGGDQVRARLEGYNQQILARIGKRNAQLQELETKKKAVIDAVAKSELTMVSAQGKCDGIAQRIKQRSAYLNELSGNIEKLKKELSVCEKTNKAKYVPIWVLVPLLLITAVGGLLLLNNFGDGGPVNVIIAVAALVSAALFVISFGRESDSFFGGAMFALFIVACIFAVTTFCGLWVEHGGPFKVISVLIDNVLFAIFGDHTDVFTSTVWSFSFFFCNAGCYIAGIIFAIIHRAARKKTKKRAKALKTEIGQKTAEYDAKVGGDAELTRLNSEYASAKAEYNVALDNCRKAVYEVNQDYLQTANAYRIKAEALVPEKFK